MGQQRIAKLLQQNLEQNAPMLAKRAMQAEGAGAAR
jgi:hypothetical protein